MYIYLRGPAPLTNNFGIVFLMEFSSLHEKLSCNITPESKSLLNCEVFQRGIVSRVFDTELILPIAHLIRLLGSIPGVG